MEPSATRSHTAATPAHPVDPKRAGRTHSMAFVGGFLVLVAGIMVAGLSQNDVTADSGARCGNSFDLVFENYSDPACDDLRSRHLVIQGVAWSMLVVGIPLLAIGVRRWWREARDAPSDRPFGVRVRDRIFYVAAVLLGMYLFSTYCRPQIDLDQPSQAPPPAESPVAAVQRVMCSQVARWCTVTPEYLASNIEGACLTLASADPYWTLSNGGILSVMSDTCAQARALGVSTKEHAFYIETLNRADQEDEDERSIRMVIC